MFVIYFHWKLLFLAKKQLLQQTTSF
jgi:hypothetical protein